jgi:hypothetical protein
MENKPSGSPEPRRPVGVVRPRTHFIRGFVMLLIIAIVGVGFYRNWFVVSTHDSPESEKLDLKISVDKAKIKEDTKKATEMTKEEAAKLSAKVKEETSKLRQEGK